MDISIVVVLTKVAHILVEIIIIHVIRKEVVIRIVQECGLEDGLQEEFLSLVLLSWLLWLVDIRED